MALFLISNAFNWGLSQIDSGYMLDTIRQSKFKATLLSVSSQIDSLFGAAAAYGMGLAITYLSYRGGFLIMALVYVVIGIPILIYLFRLPEQPKVGIL